jgi:hypothetical protein
MHESGKLECFSGVSCKSWTESLSARAQLQAEKLQIHVFKHTFSKLAHTDTN